MSALLAVSSFIFQSLEIKDPFTLVVLLEPSHHHHNYMGHLCLILVPLVQ